MKTLVILGLAIGIWSLSLVWPEANALLAAPAMLGWAIALTLGLAIYRIRQHPSRHSDRDGQHRLRSDHATRPIPVAVTR